MSSRQYETGLNPASINNAYMLINWAIGVWMKDDDNTFDMGKFYDYIKDGGDEEAKSYLISHMYNFNGGSQHSRFPLIRMYGITSDFSGLSIWFNPGARTVYLNEDKLFLFLKLQYINPDEFNFCRFRV